MPGAKAKTHATTVSSQKPSEEAFHPAHFAELGTALSAFGLVLALMAFAFFLGRKAGGQRAIYSEPPILFRRPDMLQVSAKSGVEFFRNHEGYRFRVDKVFEHRYLAEQVLRRPLRSTEVVHHINGDPADNELNNLCVMDREKHNHFHRWLREKRKKEKAYPSRAVQCELLRHSFGGTILSEAEAQSGPRRRGG